jgi:Fe-S-cluster-containing hydrogenase component 2
MSNLMVHGEKCTGCKACEAACSYHHGKIFSPKVASLRVDLTSGKVWTEPTKRFLGGRGIDNWILCN